MFAHFYPHDELASAGHQLVSELTYDENENSTLLLQDIRLLEIFSQRLQCLILHCEEPINKIVQEEILDKGRYHEYAENMTNETIQDKIDQDNIFNDKMHNYSEITNEVKEETDNHPDSNCKNSEVRNKRKKINNKEFKESTLTFNNHLLQRFQIWSAKQVTSRNLPYSCSTIQGYARSLSFFRKRYGVNINIWVQKKAELIDVAQEKNDNSKTKCSLIFFFKYLESLKNE